MDISIVLEWENALLSELGRTRQMIVSVFRQVATRPEQFELLILFNSNQVSEEFIRDFIDRTISSFGLEPMDPIRYHDALDAHYFELKNEGTKLAEGRKILFVDSDIIPEDGWLDKIMEAHASCPGDLVSGLTHIGSDSFLERAFSVNWFFPFPDDNQNLNQVSIIHSNNFMVDRVIMLKFPYPKMPEGMTRGSDLFLWKQMQQNGIRLFVHQGARATHPIPNGWSHFFNRGLAEGRDQYVAITQTEINPGNWMPLFLRSYGGLLKKVFRNTFKKRKQAHIPIWEVPLVIGTMVFYYHLFLVGGLMTKVVPKVAKESWQI
ncbi:glycosyltransferase [Algoriphagus lacus]|uniref:Glycosyltransferase n=1 Tax=Algoriphagus lacus TaxID=2056311 RepID=A0A418PNP9_9BACT|nr:glycosyltransferase [Algoriphagus lacus]RIW13643.1 glycosyltransferase [Algoriphagus lacus]